MAHRIRPYGTATPVVGAPLSLCPSPFAAYAEKTVWPASDEHRSDSPTPTQSRFQRHTLAPKHPAPSPAPQFIR